MTYSDVARSAVVESLRLENHIRKVTCLRVLTKALEEFRPEDGTFPCGFGSHLAH